MDPAPVITLLTDFGTRDTYVGVMKGVILSRCAQARIVDLTHEVEPGNIRAAGYLLEASWRFFPPGATHVAVVDPGVGGDRRILAANVGGHHFIAPDNGLLSDVFDTQEPRMVVSVEEPAVRLRPTSATFHGRDIFAPAAAALASGDALHDLGPQVQSWLHLPRHAAEPDAAGTLAGEVVHVDRFGNVITNILERDLPHADRASLAIELRGRTIRGMVKTYKSAPPGEPIALIGSTGRLEISINGSSAADALGASIGDAVHVAGVALSGGGGQS